MVIHNLNVICVPVTPMKADSPLIVDANAVLPLSVSMQRFKAVSGRPSQVPQLGSYIQLAKLSLSDALDAAKPFHRLSRVKLFRFLRPEGLNHTT